MPILQLSLPFQRRTNSDLERSRSRNLAWLWRYQLIQTQEFTECYMAQKLPQLAAESWPEATGSQLDLATDITAWIVLFDDHIEKLTNGNPEGAKKLCRQLSELTNQPPGAIPPEQTSFTMSWADMWARYEDNISLEWRTRAAKNWRGYIEAHLNEVANRMRNATPSVEDYCALRQRTCFMQVWMDITELVGRYEVPDAVSHSDDMRALRIAATNFCFMVNDVVSLEKEEIAGDFHNMVIVCKQQDDISRDEAIRKVIAIINQQVEHFVFLKSRLLKECRSAPPPEDDIYIVERFIRGMEDIMIASYGWHLYTRRYEIPVK